MQFSFFRSGRDVIPECSVDLATLAKVIRSSKSLKLATEALAQLRAANDPDYQQHKRVKLPMIYPTGEIDTRAAGQARNLRPSGTVQLDFDNIDPEDYDAAFKVVCEHPSVILAFKSPSEGIKALGLCPIIDDLDVLLSSMAEAADDFELVGLEIDRLINPSHPMFTCHDPNVYVSHDEGERIKPNEAFIHDRRQKRERAVASSEDETQSLEHVTEQLERVKEKLLAGDFNDDVLHTPQICDITWACCAALGSDVAPDVVLEILGGHMTRPNESIRAAGNFDPTKYGWGAIKNYTGDKRPPDVPVDESYLAVPEVEPETDSEDPGDPEKKDLSEKEIAAKTMRLIQKVNFIDDRSVKVWLKENPDLSEASLYFAAAVNSRRKWFVEAIFDLLNARGSVTKRHFGKCYFDARKKLSKARDQARNYGEPGSWADDRARGVGLLFQTPRVRMPVLMDSLLREGEFITLSGGSKTFKTWTLIEFALRAVSGQQWWRFKPVRPLKVLFVDLELPYLESNWRMGQIADEIGVTHKHVANNMTLFSLENAKGTTPQLLEAITRQIELGPEGDGFTPFDVVVIDPFYILVNRDGNDENSNSDVTSALAEIKLAAGNAALFGVLHHTKGSQSGKRSLDMAAGAGAYGRFVTGGLSMIPIEDGEGGGADGSGCFAIKMDLRSFEGVDPFCVRRTGMRMEIDDSLNPDPTPVGPDPKILLTYFGTEGLAKKVTRKEWLDWAIGHEVVNNVTTFDRYVSMLIAQCHVEASGNTRTRRFERIGTEVDDISPDEVG